MVRLKRWIKLFLLGICLCLVMFLILNIPVSSKQGINYKVQTIKMPLFIKAIEFLDRDYHYKKLVKSICQGLINEEDRVVAIFKWVHHNLKRDIPEGWPIVDDHVWNIIVRGYAVADQFSDVFSTLCNYAGCDAFYACVYTDDKQNQILLSFVKIEGKWRIFDPYNGNYFKNKKNQMISVAEIKSGRGWFVEGLSGKVDQDYTIYFNNLPSIKQMGLIRANIQSPLNRLRYAVRQLWK